MKLVQTCLCAVNALQRRFHRRGAVKHVQACLSARKDPMGKSCEAGADLFRCGNHRHFHR